MENGVLGKSHILHIAIVLNDIEKGIESYCKFFNMPNPGYIVTGPYEETHTMFHGKATESQAKLAFFNLDGFTIELIEPTEHPSTWREWLDQHGEGVHHIGFRVENYDVVLSEMNKNAMPAIHYGDGYAYMDTLKELKIITELLS